MQNTVKRLIIGDNLFDKKFAKFSRCQIKTLQSFYIAVLEITKLNLCQIVIFWKTAKYNSPQIFSFYSGCGIFFQIVIVDNLPERNNKVTQHFMMWCSLPLILIVCNLWERSHIVVHYPETPCCVFTPWIMNIFRKIVIISQTVFMQLLVRKSEKLIPYLLYQSDSYISTWRWRLFGDI